MVCLSGKIDEMEKIVFYDKCYNAVSLAGNVRYLDFVLTYDHPNGFTYLQLGRDFINLFLFKYMPF